MRVRTDLRAGEDRSGGNGSIAANYDEGGHTDEP